MSPPRESKDREPTTWEAIVGHSASIDRLAVAINRLADEHRRSNDRAAAPPKGPDLPPEFREMFETLGLLKPKVQIKTLKVVP